MQKKLRENISNYTTASFRKPKVLIFTDWFLPGYKAGGPVTSLANLTAHLKDDIDFYVLTRNTDYCEIEPYENIQANCWVEAAENTKVFYFNKESLSARNIIKSIKGHSFDSWYINGIYSWYFSILPLILARKIHKRKTIISPRGMLSAHALNINSLKKKPFLFIAKLAGLYRNVIFNTTNKQEKDDVRKIFPDKKVVIAPNLSRPLKETIQKRIKKEPGKLRLLSMARIAPEKNTLGALKILLSFGKYYNKKEYSISFDLYGHIYTQKYWGECQEVINNLPPQIQVKYHGAMGPENIPVINKNTHFLFLPTNGENFGHAIQESLSNATPVIISDRTPWQDLAEKNAGWDLPLDTPDQFQNVIKKCLEMDHEEYLNMSKDSFQLAKEKTVDDNILGVFRGLFT